MAKRKVSLVIGSGGIKCTAALGLYQALQQADIEVARVVGCSGGALIGALIAWGVESERARSAVVKLWTKEVMTHFNYPSVLQMVIPNLVGFPLKFSLFREDPMIDSLREFFGDVSFDQMQIPLQMVAADAQDGSKVILETGDVVAAIRASIAIPILFGPTQLDGKWLVDGGCVDPLPIDVAIKEGDGLILAMGFESPYMPQPDSVMNHIWQMTNITTNSLMKSQFAFYNSVHHDEIVLMLMRFDRPISLFDTDLIPYIIEQGQAEAERHIPYILRLLDEEQPS